MNENKLKKLWQKVKDKWADPEVRVKVYQEIASAVIWTLGAGAVACVGYTLGYHGGRNDQLDCDTFELAVMGKSGYITFDDDKEDDFIELLKQNGYRERIKK